MRLSAFWIFLVACAYQPEPQGPRVVCNGMAMPAGAGYVSSTECQEIQPDRCWNDDSDECRREQRRRHRHNRRVKANRTVVMVVLSILLVGGATAVIVSTN